MVVAVAAVIREVLMRTCSGMFRNLPFFVPVHQVADVPVPPQMVVVALVEAATS